MGTEPWYGVRLVYRLTGHSAQAYEERIVIVRASSFDEAIAKAERYSKDYEDETTVYTDYAMAFHIFEEDGSSLGEGVEVSPQFGTLTSSPTSTWHASMTRIVSTQNTLAMAPDRRTLAQNALESFGEETPPNNKSGYGG